MHAAVEATEIAPGLHSRMAGDSSSRKARHRAASIEAVVEDVDRRSFCFVKRTKPGCCTVSLAMFPEKLRGSPLAWWQSLKLPRSAPEDVLRQAGENCMDYRPLASS